MRDKLTEVATRARLAMKFSETRSTQAAPIVGAILAGVTQSWWTMGIMALIWGFTASQAAKAHRELLEFERQCEKSDAAD